MKQYQNEKAIISLTSWKERIKIVAKTIYSLIKHCPDFHIVLVLSEEEFINKEKDLPDDLNLFVNNNLIEILWVYKNYKVFKKVVFTMDKYRNVPIISADDDLLYKVNYAQELYDIWKNNQNCIIATEIHKGYDITWGSGGSGILYPPFCFGNNFKKLLVENVLKTNHDDAAIGVLADKMNIKYIQAKKYSWKDVCNESKASATGLGALNWQRDELIPILKKEINLS